MTVTADLETAILALPTNWPRGPLMSIHDEIRTADLLTAQPMAGSRTSPADLREHAREGLAHLRAIWENTGPHDQTLTAIFARLEVLLEEPS